MPPPSAAREWGWFLVAVAALACLLWACRGSRLGTPVADDYVFLNALQTGQGSDLFGPMGSPFYWRPVSRQLYFLALGPWLVEHPWLAAAAHAALLAVLYVTLYRIGRRAFAPAIAAAAALFPLLGEPTRVLLGWPSGGEYLLAATCAALAVHELLAERLWTMSLAAAAAMLSHEAAALVLPSLPAIAWVRRARPAVVGRAAGFALALGALFAVGHAVARGHGMGLPSDAPTGDVSIENLGAVFRAAALAQLNLEDQPARVRAIFGVAYAALLAATFALAIRREARARIAGTGWVLAGAALWFAAGTVPLAVLLPDWNGWRTFFPSLGLGLALSGFLGVVSPRLLAAFVALRVAALAIAPIAAATVSLEAPATASQLSFVRLARLQRTLESTRLALRDRHPELPAGARVEYLGIPNLVLFGFEDSLAARVWYRDPTLQWTSFERRPGGGYRTDALVEYEGGLAAPARAVEPGAARDFVAGLAAMERRRDAEAESLLVSAQRAHPEPRGPLSQTLWMNRAILAFQRGRDADADSFNRAALALGGESADSWALAAHLALARGDLAAARAAVERCLALDPRHGEGRYLAGRLATLPVTAALAPRTR